MVTKFLSLLLLAAAVSCNNYESHVLKSRSGDIVILNAQPVKGDGLLIAIDNANEDLASKSLTISASSSMSETELAPLIAHVVGAASMSLSVPKQVEAFSSSTIFHKPRANLLLAIADVGHYVTEELAMTSIQSLKATRPTFTLAASFEPRNPLSQLATLVTGELPSVHGIIGREWMQKQSKAAAYDDSDTLTHSAVPNVADVVSATFKNSLIVSVSADKQFASAAAAVPGTQGRSIILSFDIENKQIVNAGSENIFAIDSESKNAESVDSGSIMQLFDDSKSQALLGKFIKDGGIASLDGTTIRVQPFVNADEANSVNFDLNNSVDFGFLAELVAVQQLLIAVQISPLTVDNAPDFYSIALVGLGEMMNEYGSSASKTKFSARLVDTAVAQILSNFDAIYHSDITTQVVLMGSRPQVDSTLRKTVADIVDSSVNSKLSVDSTFPHVYVEQTVSDNQLKAICVQLNEAVSLHGMKTECLSQYARMSYVQSKATSKQDSSSSTASDKAIMFQILLWVSFGLFVTLMGSLYPLLYMDSTKGMYSSYLFAKKYV